MKKFTSRATKWLAVLALISSVILAAGVVSFAASSSNNSWQIALTAIGGIMSIIFFICFFAEKSRTLIIYKDKFIFPRGAEINGKTVFQKTVIKVDEISSIKSKFYKGDKIISCDCFFHTLKLKDGTNVTVTLMVKSQKKKF